MEKIAVIGTGIAGLGCAHFLNSRFELSLYEQNDYAGGHTNTITVQEEGRPVPIDTGFMVYNEVTYPHLTRLFKELNVKVKPTSMSFGVQHAPTGLEYCGSSYNQLFAQRKNLVNPRFIRMLMNINRFNGEAARALNDPKYQEYTLKRYIDEKGYGRDFTDLYLVPMSGAVWSTPPGLMLEFPAVTLLRFFHNHGFLGMHTQHPWLTVEGGAKSYVEKITAPFKHRIRISRKAARISRQDTKVTVTTDKGETEEVDKVVLACHADQALKILADATGEERRLLGEFKYQKNPAVLHTDASVMPRARRAWASWNYRIESGDGSSKGSTHYWMNSLQGVSDKLDYFVSLNEDRIDPSKVLKKIDYEHPLYSLGAIRAQNELPRLNLRENNRTFFCGSYFKYGFHEDAFASALEAARAVLREPLWQ